MRVSHMSGRPRSRRRYSISAPASIAIGLGVTMRKRSDGGVIASRLPASAKKAKTSSGARASRC